MAVFYMFSIVLRMGVSERVCVDVICIYGV